jgi:hypothetical protein
MSGSADFANLSPISPSAFKAVTKEPRPRLLCPCSGRVPRYPQPAEFRQTASILASVTASIILYIGYDTRHIFLQITVSAKVVAQLHDSSPCGPTDRVVGVSGDEDIIYSVPQ